MMEVSSFPLSSLGLFWPPDGDRSSSSSFLPQAKVNGIGSCNRRGEKGRRGPFFGFPLLYHCRTVHTGFQEWLGSLCVYLGTECCFLSQIKIRRSPMGTDQFHNWLFAEKCNAFPPIHCLVTALIVNLTAGKDEKNI